MFDGPSDRLDWCLAIASVTPWDSRFPVSVVPRIDDASGDQAREVTRSLDTGKSATRLQSWVLQILMVPSWAAVQANF